MKYIFYLFYVFFLFLFSVDIGDHIDIIPVVEGNTVT